jgi:hypothetical protein
MNRMKDKTRLGNTGNVLHEYDEGQNQARKYGKCLSGTMKDKIRLGNTGNVLHSSLGNSVGLFQVMHGPVSSQLLHDILQKGYQ